MNKKGGNVIRIVLGVYLIYLGVNIFIEVVQKNPANSGFMGVAVYLSLSERSMHFLRQKKCLLR